MYLFEHTLSSLSGPNLQTSPSNDSPTPIATKVRFWVFAAAGRVALLTMLRAVRATSGRARLGCRDQNLTNGSPLYCWNTPLDVVFDGIEFDTIAFCFPCAVRETSWCFFPVPAHDPVAVREGLARLTKPDGILTILLSYTRRLHLLCR